MIEELKLLKQTKSGSWVRSPATVSRENGRIEFLKSDYALKDEIKAMAGSKWHGFIEGDKRKIWSVSDCTRNNFQLDYMQGGNPYANWDKPLQNFIYERPLFDHQCLMSDHCLTYHYKILAAEMGVGKTLSAIEVMERSGVNDWWWVAPRSGLNAVDLEFEKWGLRTNPNLMTYRGFTLEIERWEAGRPAPKGVIFDESSRLKSWKSKRTKAAQHLSDAIRREHGWDGYVILMSGTPAPKSPLDWWSQCEICYPGFLKEGSAKAFEQRLGIYQEKYTDQGKFWTRTAWKDDVERCSVCGQFMWIDEEQEDGSVIRVDNPIHMTDDIFASDNAHTFVPCVNEVAYMYERLDGLALPLLKKDVLDLPDKVYREVHLEPSSTIKRVAKALAKSALSVIQGMTWLRELSDGFQYRDVQDGVIPCPVCKGEGECQQWFDESGETHDFPEGYDPAAALARGEINYELRTEQCEKCMGSGEIPKMVRETKEVKCPKEQAIRDLLEENEDQGRLVVFAGFRGSIDRIVNVCHAQQWNVVRVDGRGWKVMRYDGERVSTKLKPLNYWRNLNNERVVFVAHPESGGMGLTLTEARMEVFYSNDFKPESRRQAEDRIHRPGMDENKGATIVDLFHLGTDQKVLDVLRDNRRLEEMTLTEMKESLV